jgi:hypothetical protein
MITEGTTATPAPAQKPAGATAVSAVPVNGATSTTPPPIPSDAERKTREAEIKKRGAALKAEKDALNKDRAAILSEQKALAAEKAELSEWKRLWDQRLTDPDAFMSRAYSKEWRTDLGKVDAGDKTTLVVRQMQEQMDAQKKAQAAKDKEAADALKASEEKAKQDQADAEEKAFQEYRQDISTRWIKEHAAEFPSLFRAGLGYEIANKVRAVHKETGEVPDEMVIAKELEEQLDKVIDGVLGEKKWQEKIAAQFKPASPVRKPDPLPFQVTPRKAISQDMAPGTKPAAKPLTREERKEAIRRMSSAELEQKANQYRGLRVEAEE